MYSYSSQFSCGLLARTLCLNRDESFAKEVGKIGAVELVDRQDSTSFAEAALEREAEKRSAKQVIQIVSLL